MPITNTDLFNLLVVGILFNSGFISMLIAVLFAKWPNNLVFHTIAAVLFFTLGIIIPTTATEYYPVGWAFLLLGGICGMYGAIIGISSLVQVYRRPEEWEEEED